MSADAFVFDRYEYDPAAACLSLRYRFSAGPSFEERLVFEPAPPPLPPAARAAADRAFRLIFLLSGISYYKAFVPPSLICEAFPLDRGTALFLQNLYENGLGEFAFRNGLSLDGHCRFSYGPGPAPAPVALDLPRRTCVPVGGGKDSIVTLECLKRAGEPLVLFALGEAGPIDATIGLSGLPFVRVRRRIDPALFVLNDKGALNGHVPITGILSAIAVAGAVLWGYDRIAMSNEHSASSPNLEFGGAEINHQFSKSFAFEQEFAAYIGDHISPGIDYFSLLRPLTEVAIARRFAEHRAYFPVFRSCNTAFRQSLAERRADWCCDCPKCRFVFAALAPFLPKAELVAIFGRNLFEDAAQVTGFAALCGLGAPKPFECVGETAESAAVIAHLAGHPDWRDDAVLRRLRDIYPSLREIDHKVYRALFERKYPHRVPQPYQAMLDADG